MDEDVKAIRLQKAKSGKVSYGTPVLLHQTSKRRVLFVPFFIARSDRTEMAVKIETTATAGPDSWLIVEDKSVSLEEEAARRLLQALKDHFAVAQEGREGDYILIRVAEGTAQFGEHAPSDIAAALTKVLNQDDIVRHIRGMELGEQLTSAFKGAIRLSEMRSAVNELRSALDCGEVAEKFYQEWCENHSWAFGNAYVMRDEVREISPGDHLDLLLPTVITGFRDIVELKRPDMDVLFYDESHRNHYFSSDVSKAIGQCHRYLDVLHQVASEGLMDHPEIVAYHPRATVVIGRSQDDVDWLRGLHGLNRRLSGITVMTYDQLLGQGERLVEMLSAADEDEDESLDVINDPDDDQIPF